MLKVYKIMFFVSIAVTLTALIALIVFGLKWGVDFQGGSVLEISFEGARPATEEIRIEVSKVKGIEDLSVSPVGDAGVILRVKKTDNETAALATESLTKFGNVTLDRFDAIEPSIGQELKVKSVIAVIVLLLVVVIYISIVFRKMSAVLSPWVMGAAAIVALIHDIIIPLGVFAVLCRYLGLEIGAIFVAALLTILGYSISDTVVVFDRTRENVLRFGSREPFPALVHRSILQTLTRSLNTTITTLLALIAIFLFGGETLKYFALALIIGISLGAYSSIFVASPILMRLGKSRK